MVPASSARPEPNAQKRVIFTSLSLKLMSARPASRAAARASALLFFLKRSFLGHAHARTFEFLVDASYFSRLDIGLGVRLHFLQRIFPLSYRFANLSLLEINVAEMDVDRRVFRYTLNGTLQIVGRL